MEKIGKKHAKRVIPDHRQNTETKQNDSSG